MGWNYMLLTNDFYNANNGAFDPRHMYGVTNQDVFRWPGIEQGSERMLLGYFCYDAVASRNSAGVLR